MRKFSLPVALVTVFLACTVAGAGVVGAVSIAGHLLTTDPSPAATPTASTRRFFDGRVPVRLRAVVEGAIAPATDATVTFARNGRTVLSANVIDGGTVQAEGLPAGAYSIFVQGNEGFAAFATSLDPVSMDRDSAGDLISVGLVPPADLSLVSRLIRERRNTSVSSYSDQPTEVATDVLYGQSNLAHGSGLELSADGILRGRIVHHPGTGGRAAPSAGASVHFIQDGRIVGEAVTEADGLFRISGLDAGIYSLVVAGNRSFLVLSTEVYPPSETVAQSAFVNEFSLVSFDNETNVPVAAQVFVEDVEVIEECLHEQEPVAEESPFGACCDASGGGYGGGGGGGGGYGGSGLAEILGVAALAAGIYAIADDDDPSRIISPSRP